MHTSMVGLPSVERAKNLYKDKCPRCGKELTYLWNSKTQDYVVFCVTIVCGFCILKEGNFTYMSSG